jgi:phage tail sheath protein FI
VVGPAATTGTINLLDAVAATSLVVSGNGPGAWSANYQIAVYVSSAGFGIQVLDSVGNVLEDSGTLPDQGSAVAWSQFSNYVTVTLGVAVDNPIAMAPTVLSTGNSDRLNATDTQWQNAINMFSDDLGPGQVSAPGQTSSNRHSQLITHAVDNNRVALLDLTDSGNSGTLIGNLPIYSENTRFAAAFAPWIIIPGATSSSTRIVPPSAMIAGMIAANDPTLGVDAAAAGNQGVSKYAIGLSQAGFDDVTRETLNNAGVNVVRQMGGSIKNYGWRSLANPVTDAGWLDFGNARLFTGLSSELNAIGEQYMFLNIDGQNGSTVNNFHNALAAALLTHWTNGDLFGDTSDDAFLVDTSAAVNTLQTIANLELHAVVQVRMTPFAEFISIEIVKRQTSDSIVGAATTG